MSNYDDLIIEQLQIGPMENFTYIVGDKSTREVVIVDPAWDINSLLEHINTQGYILKAALVTHYHPDHCGGSYGSNKVEGIAELLGRQPVPIYVHKLEAAGVRRVTGLAETDLTRVESGDTLKVGDVEVEFLHTPGHTPGSQCFRIKKTLVSGDTLFINGCGRVDLPGSNPEDMYHSLRKLAALPDDTLLLPGHNYAEVPNATMDQIRRSNVYMRIPDLESWKDLMGH